MTLGQKLKRLLKDNHMTQEDLAERLDVSRQAVGKWVNDKGIPEVGKLVQISDLFGVSTDYLLKESCNEKTPADGNALAESGYYVSQEMLDGYLLYHRQSIRLICGGISLFLLSNIFDSPGSHNTVSTLFYWLTMIGGIALILWYFLQTKQYPQIKTEHLLFDANVFAAFQAQAEKRRKKYAVMLILGVAILFAGSEADYFLLHTFGVAICHICGWLIDTLWLILILWAGLSMHADSVILQNAQQPPKNGKVRKYRWIYAALPVTAIAVLIGAVTNAWRPYAPIIILFCCLLVTTCKLLIESRGNG